MQPVDWFRIMVELQRHAGLSTTEVARMLGLPKSTVHDYVNLRTQPKYSDGEAIVRLWCELLGKVPEDVPRHGRTLSAASFRR